MSGTEVRPLLSASDQESDKVTGGGTSDVIQGEEAALRRGTTSTRSAAVSLFLTFLGLGLLAMPYGIKQAGLIAGILMLAGSTLLALYSFHVISATRKLLKQSLGEARVQTFGDVGFEAFGGVGRWLVDGFTVANQMGLMAAYMQYIATELSELVPSINYRLWMLIIVWVLIAMCCIRLFKILGFFSILGVFAFLLSVTLIIVYGATKYPVFHSVSLAPSQLFLFFGIAALGFAAIAVGMQVETDMKHPEDYPKILNGIFALLFSIYMSVGVLVYFMFGSQTQAIITDNMSGWMQMVCQIALIVQLTIAIALNGYPIWPILERARFCTTANVVVKSIARATVVLICAGIAVGVPYFSLFVNLVGAIASSTLTYILPSLFHLKILGTKQKMLPYLCDLVVLTLGAGVALISTAVTIGNLVSAFQG